MTEEKLKGIFKKCMAIVSTDPDPDALVERLFGYHTVKAA